jgi:cell division protein FtsW
LLPILPIHRFKEGNVDLPFFLLTMVLLCVGIVMIYSSSYATAMSQYNANSFFLRKQLIALVLGSIAMFIFSRVPYWKLREFTWPVMILAIILLVAVFFTDPIHGARRWLRFARIGFMPSELGKYALILFYAHFLSRWSKYRDDFTKGFLPCAAALSVIVLLIMKQPDFSTSVITTLVSLFMMYIGCINIFHLGVSFITGAVASVMVVMNTGFRWSRIGVWLDPFSDRFGTGYQIVQSLIAVGSGGVFGKGLGNSQEKFGNLPYQYNDYIFAIIGEELGLIGCIIIISLFFLFAWRGFKIAMGAPELFGTLLAAGITFHIVLQAFTNMAVVINLLPATGLPLPFISYSGSSLVMTMTGVGVLLNISKYARYN